MVSSLGVIFKHFQKLKNVWVVKVPIRLYILCKTFEISNQRHTKTILIYQAQFFWHS